MSAVAGATDGRASHPSPRIPGIDRFCDAPPTERERDDEAATPRDERRSTPSIPSERDTIRDLPRPAAPPAFLLTPLAILKSKPFRALVWFAVLGAVPYLHPSLRRFRLLSPRSAETDAAPRADAPTGITPEYGDLLLKEGKDERPPEVEPPPPPEVMVAAAPSGSASESLSEVAVAVGATARPLEDPTGHAMDGFWSSLARTEAGAPDAITRVAHYGDSLLVSDFMSSTLRRRFQARFGDAGHGFLLLAKPWSWYFHQDVTHWSSDGWITHRIVNPRIGDEMYGYGGATFRTVEGGARASFGTAKPPPQGGQGKDEPFGRRVSHFQVHYLEQPDGGLFDLILDGKKVRTVSTRAPAKHLAVADVDAEDGEHTLDVRALGGSEARLFGVALERRVAGVVWDALGVNGGRARMLDVNDDAHWAEALRARDPALLVFQYGTNESEDTGYPMQTYESTFESVLEQARAALPAASCLVVGAMDRAGAGTGGMETRPIIPKLVDAQRRVALRTGCAFWDTYLAMGGKGSMARWFHATPRLGGGDLTHPTSAGAALLGDLLYGSLMSGYASRPR